MRILIIPQWHDDLLHDATYAVCSAATTLQQYATTSVQMDLLIAGHNCNTVAAKAAIIAGINHVLVIDDLKLQYKFAEDLALAIHAIIIKQNYEYVLLPATTFGKNLAPKIATLCDVQQISDVNKIIAADSFTRPIYAGNAIVNVTSNDERKILTIRPTAFAKLNATQPATRIVTIPLHTPVTAAIEFVNFTASPHERPELTSAKIVIAGGRGLQNKEQFKILDELANRLHAAIGASRAAVDAGFAPNDYQIGQTGKIVAPELYIAIGISGAIQHLAGMKDSKIIVAINQDAKAPIFQIADLGLVGDLFTIVPELCSELDKLSKS